MTARAKNEPLLKTPARRGPGRHSSTCAAANMRRFSQRKPIARWSLRSGASRRKLLTSRSSAASGRRAAIWALDVIDQRRLEDDGRELQRGLQSGLAAGELGNRG